MAWQAPIEVDQGRGERGPWRQNDSRYDFVDDLAVALAPDGAATLAWVDQADKAVLSRTLSADGQWVQAAPVDVSRQPDTFSWLPRVARVPDAPQRVLVQWQEIIFSGGSHGGEMMVARSADGGDHFSAPVNLSRSPGGDGKGRVTREVWHNGSHDLSAGPSGVVQAAWTAYDGALWVSRSVDGGASFSSPRQVAAQARAPSLAFGRGPGGRWYLAWAGVAPGPLGVHLAVSADGGASFGPPWQVGVANGPVDAPRLVAGPGGALHLAFGLGLAGTTVPREVRYTRSWDGGRRFEPARVLSAPVASAQAGAGFAQLGVDGRGRVLVVWEAFGDGTGRPRGLGYAVSRDGGRRFTPPALVPHAIDPGGGWNGSSQGLLGQKLAINEAGDIAVALSALKTGSHSRVWLVRGRLAG